MLFLQGGLLKGNIATHVANAVIAISATTKPVVSKPPEKISMRIVAKMAIFVADVMLKVPPASRQVTVTLIVSVPVHDGVAEKFPATMTLPPLTTAEVTVIVQAMLGFLSC